MYVVFTPTHLDTLCKLKEIAAKHNCTVSFGFSSTGDDDGFTTNILKANDVAPEIIEMLEALYENNDLNDCKLSHDQIYFKLSEKTPTATHNHTLEYNEDYMHFSIKDYNCLIHDYINKKYDNENQLDMFEDFAKDISANNDDIYPFFSFDYCPTIINGFGLGHVEDERVYRQGMALKYFADLVCDYLNEPHIEATY